MEGEIGDTSESVTLLLDGKVFIIVIINIILFNSSRENTKFDIFHVSTVMDPYYSVNVNWNVS